MSFTTILAASVLVMPQASDAVMRAPDLRSDRERGGQLYLQMLVAPDRTVQSCDVIYSDVSDQIGLEACEHIQELQFETSAIGADGNPIYGVYVLVTTRIVGSFFSTSPAMDIRPTLPPSRLLPDIVVSVQNLPAAYGTEKLVSVLAQVDAAGVSGVCEGYLDAPVRLAELACQQLVGFQFPITSDRSGQPVSYVREVRINFVENGG